MKRLSLVNFYGQFLSNDYMSLMLSGCIFVEWWIMMIRGRVVDETDKY